jgi:hypothetical protein
MQTTQPASATFVAGVTYSTRSICDSDCIYRVTIVSRTDKTVKADVGAHNGGVKTFRLGRNHYNAECFMPFGRYSMAPTIRADRIND